MRARVIPGFRISSLSLALLTTLLSACTPDEVPADDRGSDDETGDGDGDGDGDTESETETGEDCPPGILDCPCDVGSTCEADLTCVDGTCQSDAPLGSCGDGIVDPGEECDDGNDSNTDACLDDCTNASCGDGFVGSGEGCDDGNDIDDDECSNACALASCGDGMVQTGEACDDGNADNSDDCLDTCVDASCGDGFVQAGVEECDDANAGNSDTCVSGCLNATCGDGHLGPGEGCDDGNDVDDDECSNACALASCGDGEVQIGEACDDANDVETDACLSTCASASCGDSFVQAGVEDCDDGNGDDADACPSSCSVAACGDGFVWAGNEECDDGNANDTDACPSTCANAVCGDGFAWAGTEACDDGNAVETDACLSTCVTASCGDGYVWASTESCDDGNMIANDGCEASCSVSPGGQKVVLGAEHTCVLTWAGQVKCWGGNSNGQLGYGNTDPFLDGETPATVGWVDIGGVAIDLEAGASHNCALLEDHSVVCWGYNLQGQLGYGHTNRIGDDEVPSSAGVIELDGDALDIALGGSHGCALMVGGGVRCWGHASSGQLGYGNQQNIGDNEIAGAGGDVGVGGPAVQISAGGSFTCALNQAGEVRCWGYNFYGSLGYGHTNGIGDDELPSTAGAVNLGPKTVVELQSGAYHNCVRFDDNTIKCWGQNWYGQLGYGHTNGIGDNETPAAVGFVNIGGPVTGVEAIGNHTCAIYDGGSVRCWGINNWGQLGYGHVNYIGDNELPSSVGFVSVGAPVVTLANGASVNHTCVTTSTGGVRCWGYNSARKLGYGHALNIGDDELPSSAGDVQIE